MGLASGVITTLLLLARATAQTQLSGENAYNPIPSPDGKKIAAVRTGWNRLGGSGGMGRSNLRSDIIVLDLAGRTLSSKSLVDNFVAGWKQEGIVSFRDWSYALISEEGSIRQQGRVCPPEPAFAPNSGCVERVTYLSKVGTFVSVRQQWGDSVLVTPRGEFSTHHKETFLGEWLVPSPDERYIATGPGGLGRSLSIYDSQGKTWFDLGAAIIHPDRGWNWMQPSWSPWFADSSQLAFFTTEGLVVSSPDGKKKRIVVRTQEPAGLAVPSPDGHAIAYATFASRPGSSGTGSPPIWNCTGIWVVGLEESSEPRRLTEQGPTSTLDLRWIDNQHLVFDRVEQGIPPKARLWMVAADR